MERTKQKTPVNKFGLPNIVIPAEVLLHPNLTLNEKILFGVVNNLANNNHGYCWASNRYLSKMTRTKINTVSIALSKLKKEHFIKMEYTTAYAKNRKQLAQVRKIYINKAYPDKYEKMLEEIHNGFSRTGTEGTPYYENQIPPYYENQIPPYYENQSNIDIIDIDSYDNTKVLSDDPPEPSAPSVHPDVENILSFWFKLPNTVQHKTSSRIYERAIQVIDNLLNGLPIQVTKDGQPYRDLKAFCIKHKIHPELLTKKWPKNTIKGILKSIHQHLSDESGQDKISLDTIFWNKFAQNGGWSWFLFKAAEKSVPDQYLEMASKLAQAIQVDLTEAKAMSWAKDFQVFCKNKSEQEVNQVLDWYMKNYDYQYVKSVQSVKPFIQFYSNIKKSMKNQEQDNHPRRFSQPAKGRTGYDGRAYPKGESHEV